MAFPQSYTQGAINRYQGVIIAEVACMLVFYILLKMIHFFKWGHLYLSGEESEGTQSFYSEKKEADTDERVCILSYFRNGHKTHGTSTSPLSSPTTSSPLHCHISTTPVSSSMFSAFSIWPFSLA